MFFELCSLGWFTAGFVGFFPYAAVLLSVVVLLSWGGAGSVVYCLGFFCYLAWEGRSLLFVRPFYAFWSAVCTSPFFWFLVVFLLGCSAYIQHLIYFCIVVFAGLYTSCAGLA